MAMALCRPDVVSALLDVKGASDTETLTRASAIDSCPTGREYVVAHMSNKSLEQTLDR
jgi:hypothetical protein